ncbi:MAG TPA: TolC family protein [Candidatus Omnitrophota bacterium]|nr:TolC family protein [Candidatus Omnitrophota bacterium]HPS37095.1 TolC family protein [Candidatus Omnitrophota bacterium]
MIFVMISKKMLGLFLVVGLAVTPVSWASEAASAAPQAGPERMTFLDCYQKVLTHYPALKKRYEQLEQARAGRNLAVADLFPHVQGVFSTTTTDDPVGVFSDLLRQHAFTEQNFELNSLNSPRHRTNYHFGIEGDMLLFDSFNTISKIRSALRLVKSADLQADFTEMEAAVVTLESYLGILLAKELYRVASEVKNASDKDLQQAKDLNDKGMILGADYYAAKVTAAGIERQLNHAKATLKSSRMLMNILMGEDPEFVWEAAGKLPEFTQDAGALRTWIAEAYQKRQDLAALDQMLDAQRIEKLRQKTSFLPKFYGFGSLDDDSHDFHSGGRNFTVGFKGTMDFFDATYPGRVKEAGAKYKELAAERDALRDEIAKQLVGELARYETVTLDAPVMKSAYADATQATEQTAKLYQEGRKSIADLLEMRRGYFETAAGYQDLLLALELEYAKLLFLSGQLTEDGIHQVNTRLKG